MFSSKHLFQTAHMEGATGESENVSRADYDKCCETEKKLRRREQNRRAAQRFRDKERRKAINVMEEHKRYKSANAAIRYELKILQKEKEILEKTLQHHKAQTCRLQKPVSDDGGPSLLVPAARVVDSMNFYQSQESEGLSGFTHPSQDRHLLSGSEPGQHADRTFAKTVRSVFEPDDHRTLHGSVLPQTRAVSNMHFTLRDSAPVCRQSVAGFRASPQLQQPEQPVRQQPSQPPTRQHQSQTKVSIPTVVDMVESDECQLS